MKYYESHFEEYTMAIQHFNLHPEIDDCLESFPDHLSQFGNLIVYGASGIGKYSQVLRLLQKYSPSGLKYDKHMCLQTEKQTYTYRISDVHYEIDMALLGCNSKMVWHEIFSQIVDIVSMKSDKNGIIVCKNFHSIHTELLDIFYSYMQQYNHPQLNIHIKFLLITEHLSFISSRILDNCRILQIKRPSKDLYQKYIDIIQPTDKKCVNNLTVNKNNFERIEVETPQNHRRPPPAVYTLGHRTSKKAIVFKAPLQNEIVSFLQPRTSPVSELFTKQIMNTSISDMDMYKKDSSHILDNIEPCDILNLKELRVLTSSIKNIDSSEEIPKEIFNNVCDAIIHELTHPDTLVITSFRDTLYDILIYNLDAVECFWYIFTHFIHLGKMNSNDISIILDKTYTFLKYYNNNYRPIYHLENIFLLLLTKIQQ